MKQLLILLMAMFIKTSCFGQSTDIGDLVDAFVEENMTMLEIPGMAVAVVKDGDIVKLKGYGIANLEWNTEVTEHTSFQIASCTKLLTSTLLLKALYENKINLEDYVNKYIDSIPEEWNQLKIKHLVNHSSGLKEYSGDKFISARQVVGALKDSTLEYSPGTNQHYAQMDFMLLGNILEGIYNQPYTLLLRDEVLVPLEMADGGFEEVEQTGEIVHMNLIKEKAASYYNRDGMIHSYRFDYPQYSYTAGGYYASAGDLANWAIGLDRETLFTRDFSESYIYGCDSIENNKSMFTRAGWVSRNEDEIIYAGHSGGPGLADILRFPEQGYTFIVLTNDGEVLPYFAKAIASFYIKDLKAGMHMKKYKRQ